MTQINLANLITQMQPANTGQAIGNDAGQSAKRLKNAEKKNLAGKDDPQKSNGHKDFDNNTLKDSKSDAEFESKPNPSEDVPVAIETEDKESIDSKPQAAEINFEEIVASINIDSNLRTEQPAGNSEANLEITPAEMSALIAPKNEFDKVASGNTAGLIEPKAESVIPTVSDGKLILGGKVELPTEAANNSIAGEAIENNTAEIAQAVPAFVAVERPHAPAPQAMDSVEISPDVPKTDFQQIVSPVSEVSPEIKSDASASIIEIGEIKLEGFQAETKPTVVDLPLVTKEFDIAAGSNEPLEVEVNSQKISQQAQKTEVSPQGPELREAIESVAGMKPNQIKPQTRPFSPEPVEKLTEGQIEYLDLDPKIAQVRRNLASRIASYREVQESVPSESGPVKTLMPKGDPPILLTENAKAEQSVGNAVSKIATNVAQTRANTNSRVRRASRPESMPLAEIDITQAKADTAVVDPNLDAAAQLIGPGESGGLAAVSSASSIADIVSARPGSAEMIEQITKHIQSNRSNLGEQMTVRLDPPELGQIKIQITGKANEGLRAVIHVEHSRTLTELNREAPALIQKLSDAGIQIKDLEFRMTGQNEGRGDSAQSNTSNSFDNSNSNSQGRGGQADGEAESFSNNNGQYGREFHDLTTEVDDTYISGGHYVSEDSLNVMV